MKFAICDDTNLDLKNLESIIMEYSKKNNVPIELELYNDPRVLVNRVTYFDSKEFSVYFLDICMQENGIEIAEKIRTIDNEAIIVFATSSKDYAIDAFKVRATDYILKPLDKNEIFNLLDRILDKLGSSLKTSCKIKTIDHSIISVDIKNISCVESNDRRMIFHMNDKTELVSTSLRSKFLVSIPFEYDKYNFINCHSSYIVNMNQIKAISDYSFVMKNGMIVPISKRLLTAVKDVYIKYLIGE